MREIKIPRAFEKMKKRKTTKNRLFNDLTETFTSRLTSSQEDKVEKWKKNSIKLRTKYNV